jgi:WD40 repeat protein
VFAKHAEPVIRAVFTAEGRATLSGSSDSAIRYWDVSKLVGAGK